MMRACALLLLVPAAVSCRSGSKGDGTPPPRASAVSGADAAPTPPTPPTQDEMAVECPAAILEARRDGALPDRFVVPSDDERRSMRQLVASLTAEKVDVAAARRDAARIGFEILDAAEVPGSIVLREVEGRRRGGGAYVVRLGSASRLFVQAPHTFYDEGTLPLACSLFRTSNARALFVSTVHRYKGAPPDANGQHPSDVAHAPATLFQAGTEGVLDAMTNVTVVQLHGFAAREVRARAVVSSGERRPGNALVARVAAALEAVVGPPVLTYPEGTSELGATTNVQGAIVRAARGRFVHIEMDEALRRDLQADAALRGRAFAALSGPLGGASAPSGLDTPERRLHEESK